MKIEHTIIDKIYYSYNTIHNIINTRINQIIEFNPDYIIAIGGGGLIPARIIKTHIEKPILVVSVSLYDNQIKRDKVTVIQWIPDNLRDKKILLVDAIDDTRTTLKFCIDKLEKENNATNISTFVLHNKIKDKVDSLSTTNYIKGEEIKDVWVVYPWDHNDFIN